MSQELTQGWNEWSKAMARAFAQDLSSSLRSTMSSDVEKAEVANDVDVRADLASDAVGFFANLPDGKSIGIFAGGAHALALASSTTDSEATALGDAEKAALKEFGTTVTQCIQEQFRKLSSTAVKWDDPAVAFMSNSTWEGGEDRIPSGELLRATLKLQPESGDAIALELVMAKDLASSPFNKLESFSEDTEEEVDLDAPRHILSFCPDPKISERITSLVGESESCATAESVTDFLSRFAADEINVGVIQVRSGDEFWLPLLGDLKSRADKPLIVVLEEPKTWRVVQCGRLGIFGVLSPDFSSRDFQGRVRSERLQPAS